MEWLLLVSLLLNIHLLIIARNATDEHIRTLKAFRSYINGDIDRSLRIISGKED